MSEAPSIDKSYLAQSRRQQPSFDAAGASWSALDRKYSLLDETPRRVLHRLSVFVGGFTPGAACAVAAGAGLQRAGVSAGIAALQAGSLLECGEPGGNISSHYALSVPTRAFARGKLVRDGELDLVARKHAHYLQCVLEYAEVEFDRREPQRWMPHYVGLLDDVRAALEWAFSPAGDPIMGVDLTVAAIPLWLLSSQADELQTRLGRALSSKGALAHSGRRMRLLTAARLAGIGSC